VRPRGENTLIQSEQQGRIARVLIRANQRVQAHQVLAVLDQQHLRTRQRQLSQELQQVARQRQQTQRQQGQLQMELSSSQRLQLAAIAVSRGDVRKAQASLALASTERQRYEELARVGAVPLLLSQEKAASFLIADSSRSQAELAVAQQRARLQAETARLAQGLNSLESLLAEQTRQALALRSALADVNRLIDQAAIRSPVAATVVSTQLNHAGQVVNAGEVIADLAPLQAPLVIKAQIPAKEVGNIRAGQRAYLRIGACPLSRFGLLKGRVAAISADSATAAGGAGTGPLYELTIQPEGRELRQGRERCALRIGMDLQADVLTRRTSLLGFLSSKLRLGGGA
jgi:multidrug resistance efflux pump